MSSTEAAYAFNFECDKTLEEILSLVNQAGP